MTVGASTILGNFGLKLGLDDSDYAKGILHAQGLNQVFGQSVATFIANPLLGAVDLMKKAAAGAAKLGIDVLGSAEHVQRLGQVTGATSELIQALETRLDLAGHGSEKAGMGLRVLAKNMAEARNVGGPLKDIFDELGVSLAPGAPLDAGLASVLDGLLKIEDPAKRLNLAMKLIGEEAGPALINAVGGGSDALRQMVEEGRRLGTVLGDDAVNQLADFNTTLGYAQTAIEGVKRNLTARFLIGFIREFGTGTDQVQSLADMMNTTLGPRMELVGQKVAHITGNIEELNKHLETMVGLLDNTLGRFERLNNSTGGFLTMSGIGIAKRLYSEYAKPVLDEIDPNALQFASNIR